MDWKKLMSEALTGLAHAVHTVSASSALDAETRAGIQTHLDNAKQAAAKLAGETLDTVQEGVEAAPAAAGAFAGAATSEAASKVPGVGALAAPVLASVVQAAVTLALGHWVESLEAHNGDHIAAARSAIENLADGAPNSATAEAVLAATPPNGAAALDDASAGSLDGSDAARRTDA